jgi:hypothetical protein
MRFGLGVELWSGSKQSEEEATAAAAASREDDIVVTKVDMRKKEHKPTKEDVERMNAIMDSIVNEDSTDDDTEEPPF